MVDSLNDRLVQQDKLYGIEIAKLKMKVFDYELLLKNNGLL